MSVGRRVIKAGDLYITTLGRMVVVGDLNEKGAFGDGEYPLPEESRLQRKDWAFIGNLFTDGTSITLSNGACWSLPLKPIGFDIQWRVQEDEHSERISKPVQEDQGK